MMAFFGLKHVSYLNIILPNKSIPVARRLRHGSKAARLLGLRVRILLGEWMSLYCECCVLSGRDHVGLITLPEESHRT